MNAKETERIIAFHGMRRGAAHVRTGADGTHVALTLRPGTRAGAPMPTAACLAGVDGKTVRIALTNGVGQTPLSIDPAVILLIADAPQGEAFCAEGARGTLDRRAVEMLKRPMRALRQAGQQSSEAPQEEEKLKEMPDMVKQKPEHMEASVPAASHAPGAQAVVSEAEPEGNHGNFKAQPARPRPAADRRTGGKKQPPSSGQKPPQPRSEALLGILSKANELFPPGGGDGGAEAHFASDEPLRGAFMPRPLAAQAAGNRKCPGGTIRAGTVAASNGEHVAYGAAPPRDTQWSDAVRELSRPEEAPKPSGVGMAEAAGSLFPEAFPGISWRRVRYPGTRRYYLEGVGLVNGGRCIIYALPGENYPAQPYRARGFTRFVRDVNGNGYWVKVKRTNNNG